MEDLNNKSIWALKGSIDKLIDKLNEMMERFNTPVIPAEVKEEVKEIESPKQLSMDFDEKQTQDAEVEEVKFDTRAFSKILNNGNKVTLTDQFTFRTRCKWNGVLLWQKCGLTYKEAIEYRNEHLHLLKPMFDKAFEIGAFKSINGYENVQNVEEAFSIFKSHLADEDKNYFKREGGKKNE